MDIKDRVVVIIEYFSKQPLVKTELNFNNPYQLIIAIVLSAQCTDKRVNLVTPTLFDKYNNFTELSIAKYDEVYNVIKSISYPKIKTQRIINISKILSQKYDETIPNNVETLVNIDGIGRKTANLVTAILYDAPHIAVDTHVARVSTRLELVKSNNPDKIETELSSLFPQKYHNKINPWFVMFGRYKCKSIKPNCENCDLKNICSYRDLHDK